ARKTLGECRAMRQPVFDNDFLPRDRGKLTRWYGWGQETRWLPEEEGRVFVCSGRGCAADDVGREHDEHWDWLCYRHLVRDHDDGRTVWTQSEVKDVAGYNGAPIAERIVHDFLLEAEAQCKGAGRLAIAVTDGLDDVLIEMPIGQDGTATVRRLASNR